MSKQTTRQIALLIILVFIGAVLLWNVEPALEQSDTTSDSNELGNLSIFNAGIQEEMGAPDEDPLIAMYRDEGFPTATQLSPNLREYMVALFTQTDAFTVVQRMQFGDTDEWATIVHISSSVSADERLEDRVCGIYGQPLCILFYQNGDRTEVLDVYQSIDPNAKSYYPYMPEIIDILSMPHAGEVLVAGFEPFGIGKDFVRWDVASVGGERVGVAELIATEDGLQVRSERLNLAFDLDLNFTFDEKTEVLQRHAEIRDGERVLLSIDGEPLTATFEGSAWHMLDFSIDAMETYGQDHIRFSLLDHTYGYGYVINEQGERVTALWEIEE